MAPQRFGGGTSLTDAHDTIKELAGNATWLCEYLPVGEDRIAEVLLWLCHSEGLCCTIAGEYAMYRAGKLASRPNTITLYIATPQTRSRETDMLLQEQQSENFAWGGVGFELDPLWTVPGRQVRYTIRHGGEEIKLAIFIINSDSPCGPRSNLDLMNHVWTLSDYYCTNYAIVVLPSRTSDDKLVYVRHYRAEMGGMTTRRCNNCVCLLDDTVPFYDFGCKHPQKCTCTLCSAAAQCYCRQTPLQSDSEYCYHHYDHCCQTPTTAAVCIVLPQPATHCCSCVRTTATARLHCCHTLLPPTTTALCCCATGRHRYAEPGK